MKLLFKAITKYTVGLAFVALLLFLPAGTLHYTNAWIFMGLLFLPILILGAVLFFKAPDLLRKRLDVNESERTQRGVIAASALLFVAGFIVAGLDFRFGWSRVPVWCVITASAVLIISYAVYAEVMRENAYLSRSVEIQNGQRVIDTGLYGVVRHPMYSATIGIFLAIPIVLGSWWSLLCLLPYIPLIAVRIVNEEKVLESGLEGYSEYKKRVRYRLVPFIW